MEEKKVTDVTFTWREGRYLDLWLFVHFVTGAWLSFLFLLLDLDRGWAYIIALVLIVGWEWMEKVAKVTETTENQVIDIIVGFFAFVVGYEVSILSLGRESLLALLIFASIMLALLALYGWLDYRKRSREEV